MSKITQEKDKEILKLSHSLATSKEDLLLSRRVTGDFEIKQKQLEEKLEKLQITLENKEEQIKHLQQKINLVRNEKERFVSEVKCEKENIMVENNREMKSMSDEYKKEISRAMENVSLSKLELSRFHEKVEKMKVQQDLLGMHIG